MKAIALAVAGSFVLVLVVVLTTPARTQTAVGCVCYCGLTIAPPCSEQACKSAGGYSEPEPGGGHPSGPVQVWYCRAVAPNGAWGWAHSSSQGGARQAALNECRTRAAGCVLDACRFNDPSLAQAPNYTPQPAPGQGPTTGEQAWCDTCMRKLQNDVYSGWASALVRSYIGQAIAGYQNCKQMLGKQAGGSCPMGDAMVADLQRCSRFAFGAYRDCLSIAARLNG